MLVLDLSNPQVPPPRCHACFNTISRYSVFEGIRDSPLASILFFVSSFYLFPAPLHYVCRSSCKIVTLLSSTGTRQGDPQGGSIFALRLHTALSRVHMRIPPALIATCADDTLVHGPPELLPTAFQAYVEEAAAAALALSTAKCRVWAPLRTSCPEDVFPEVFRIRGCFRVLEIPVGKIAELEAALEEDLTDWRRGLDELPAWDDSQVALSLLRLCATARLRFLQRTLKPTQRVFGVY